MLIFVIILRYMLPKDWTTQHRCGAQKHCYFGYLITEKKKTFFMKKLTITQKCRQRSINRIKTFPSVINLKRFSYK